jgi:pyrimidine-nucleoside phosphorylase
VEELGILARDLGAGRTNKEDTVDPYAGFILHKRIGSQISLGEKWITLHSTKTIADSLVDQAQSFITISKEIPRIPQLIIKRIN